MLSRVAAAEYRSAIVALAFRCFLVIIIIRWW
jgi:hypothetical protein